MSSLRYYSVEESGLFQFTGGGITATLEVQAKGEYSGDGDSRLIVTRKTSVDVDQASQNPVDLGMTNEQWKEYVASLEGGLDETWEVREVSGVKYIKIGPYRSAGGERPEGEWQVDDSSINFTGSTDGVTFAKLESFRAGKIGTGPDMDRVDLFEDTLAGQAAYRITNIGPYPPGTTTAWVDPDTWLVLRIDIEGAHTFLTTTSPLMLHIMSLLQQIESLRSIELKTDVALTEVEAPAAVMQYPVASPDCNPPEQAWKAACRAVSHNLTIPRLPEPAEQFERHLTPNSFASSFRDRYGFNAISPILK